MIELNDISELMQTCVSKGYTFMFSQSGIDGLYNVNIAYMPKTCDIRSLNMTFVHPGKEALRRKEGGFIYRSASTENKQEVFDCLSDVVTYIDNEMLSDDDKVERIGEAIVTRHLNAFKNIRLIEAVSKMYEKDGMRWCYVMHGHVIRCLECEWDYEEGDSLIIDEEDFIRCSDSKCNGLVLPVK